VSNATATIPTAAEQPTVDVLTAGRAVGVSSHTTAYRMAQNGEFPFPVLRIGRQWRVPTAALRQVLGLGPEND
jgi:hypothetical protein